MSKINVQFHAEPNEIVTLIKECVKEFNLYVVLVKLQPSFTATLINTSDDVLENVATCNTNRVCLCINQPNTLANSYLEFIDRNPDCLSITIGKFCDDKLEESVLATKTENIETFKVWKKVVKKLNFITLAGVWVVNPSNEAKAFYKQHRYTEGAKKLFEDGVKIMPVAGWNYYILGE